MPRTLEDIENKLDMYKELLNLVEDPKKPVIQAKIDALSWVLVESDKEENTAPKEEKDSMAKKLAKNVVHEDSQLGKLLYNKK